MTTEIIDETICQCQEIERLIWDGFGVSWVGKCKWCKQQEQLVEAMAKSAHDCWYQEYLKLGYKSRKAEWGEEFMVPYEDLSNQGKEFDRVIMRAILAAFETNGYIVREK